MDRIIVHQKLYRAMIALGGFLSKLIDFPSNTRKSFRLFIYKCLLRRALNEFEFDEIIERGLKAGVFSVDKGAKKTPPFDQLLFSHQFYRHEEIDEWYSVRHKGLDLLVWRILHYCRA